MSDADTASDELWRCAGFDHCTGVSLRRGVGLCDNLEKDREGVLSAVVKDRLAAKARNDAIDCMFLCQGDLL